MSANSSPLGSAPSGAGTAGGTFARLGTSTAPTDRGPMRSPTGFRPALDHGPSGGSQGIADRVEIEALRAEFTDAVMMRDYDRLASLFTTDGALRIPEIPVDLMGQDAIRAWGARTGGRRVPRADGPPGDDPL